jgi:hypothetical protein
MYVPLACSQGTHPGMMIQALTHAANPEKGLPVSAAVDVAQGPKELGDKKPIVGGGNGGSGASSGATTSTRMCFVAGKLSVWPVCCFTCWAYLQWNLCRRSGVGTSLRDDCCSLTTITPLCGAGEFIAVSGMGQPRAMIQQVYIVGVMEQFTSNGELKSSSNKAGAHRVGGHCG